MKLNYLFIVCFFAIISAHAQMYVSPNTYVYVDNTHLYVKQDIELNASTSNVYLRNNANFIQGTTGTSANKGLGSLSVYQEGTVNNYQYNYWCSPVGAVSASAGNSAFSITQLGVPTTVTATNPAMILAYSNWDGVSSAGALSIASRWIYKFITSNAYSQWSYVGSGNLNAGEGFSMKGTSGTDATTVLSVQNNAGSAQRYDFRGKPNDGNISVALSTGNLTLTGNPYPSTIDLRAFLIDPANTAVCDGNALFWEHDKTVNSHYLSAYKGGYGTYNGATNVYTVATYSSYNSDGTVGGASAPVNPNTASSFGRRYSPVGQGFMLRGIASGNVQFKNSYRSTTVEGTSTSLFAKNASSGIKNTKKAVANDDYQTPRLRINTLLNNVAVRENSLAFLPNAIDGYDLADSKSPDVDNKLPYDSYFPLSNTEFVQYTTNFDLDKKIPFAFKNNQDATFKMRVVEFINIPEVNNVYLHDKQTDLYLDIKNADAQVDLPKGVYNDRFEITFKNNEVSLGVNDVLNDKFIIYQNNNENKLIVKNPTNISLKLFRLYDVTGKVVFEKNNLGAQPSYEFSSNGLSEGVYIAKLITDSNQELSKKVSISNKK